MTWDLIVGNSLDVLRTWPDACVDSVVTDPPYELAFMGRKWDATGIAFSVDLWREVLRVMKPGAFLLAFGGTRTVHRMVCAIEDAGFEIRDQIDWLYANGFPKNHDISKALPADSPAFRWAGWGTALKPAHEPICVARKPLVGTYAENILTHGTGALNVEGCRVGWVDADDMAAAAAQRVSHNSWSSENAGTFTRAGDLDLSIFGYVDRMDAGRWPSNVIMDAGAAALLGEVSRILKIVDDDDPPLCFQYTPKPDAAERDAGCDPLPVATGGEATDREDGSAGVANPRAGAGRLGGRRNIHPTVKPIDLMRYLVRLVTPPSGRVLDPFCGSGSTGCGAVLEGMDFTGIDLETPHACIAWHRLMYWDGRRIPNGQRASVAKVDPLQRTLF